MDSSEACWDAAQWWDIQVAVSSGLWQHSTLNNSQGLHFKGSVNTVRFSLCLCDCASLWFLKHVYRVIGSDSWVGGRLLIRCHSTLSLSNLMGPWGGQLQCITNMGFLEAAVPWLSLCGGPTACVPPIHNSGRGAQSPSPAVQKWWEVLSQTSWAGDWQKRS